MDDNLSTKSSESSLTTSGEYEIVSDSNITTPIDHHDMSENGTLLVIPTNNKSPTLNLANNRNIADLQHAMTDALREIDLNSDTSSTGKSSFTFYLLFFVKSICNYNYITIVRYIIKTYVDKFILHESRII